MALSSNAAFLGLGSSQMPGAPAAPPTLQQAAPASAASPRPWQVAPLSAAAGAVALALGAASKHRKPIATRRHFFGDSTPQSAKATSYKDYKDPWLESADLGFDPLNLAVGSGIFDTAATAVPETTYYNYRESEVKHGRFAMGAFLAIFAESADRSALGRQLGSATATDSLDGTLGFDELQLPVLAITLGIQALAEYNLQRSETDGNILSVQYKRDRCPGDLGFDPLGLSKGKGSNLKVLHNTEVNAGRLALIGVTSFIFKEFVVKDPSIASKIL